MKKLFNTSLLLWAICLVFSSCATAGGVKQTLKNGGFSGALDRKAKISKVGSLRSDKAVVTFFYYEREFGNKRLTQRLIAIKDGKYLGMYAVNDPPVRVTENAVCFSYPSADGNCIVLSHGDLPDDTYLDGESVVLFK